ncbi:MAG: AMP-binding protein [Bacteroidia bacterium]|nr:AMP-binding protein [Bacteroidia bacterium]MDW8332661.1 AMP-binding protein [Bacteroidia bacterium]
MNARHLPELWDQIHEKYPADTPIFHRADGTALTYKQMHAYIHCLAAYWMSIGIRSGENIVFWSPNGPYYASVELAALMAGAVVHTPPPQLRPDELHDLVARIRPVSLYLDSYQYYRDNRYWLNEVARYCRIVCRLEKNDTPLETDKISTFDGAIDRGKNYWRENREAFAARKKSISPQDKAYALYRSDASFAGFVVHGKLVELLDRFVHKGTVLSAGPPSSLLERLGVLYNALRWAKQVHFHPIGDFTREVVRRKPDYVSLTPVQLDNWRIAALQNFKLKRRILGRFADASIVRAAEIRLNQERKIRPATRFKHRFAQKYIFKPLREKYYPGIKGLLVEGYSQESEEFFAALELPLLVPQYD